MKLVTDALGFFFILTKKSRWVSYRKNITSTFDHVFGEKGEMRKQSEFDGELRKQSEFDGKMRK